MKIIDDRPTNKVTKHVIFGTAAEYGNVKKNYNQLKKQISVFHILSMGRQKIYKLRKLCYIVKLEIMLL